MEELIKELADKIAREATAKIMANVRRECESVYKAQMKCVYSETEAADFLGVTESTVAAWRRRKLITYANYPVARVRDKQDDDSLGDTYTYSLSDLLSFRERYVIQCVSTDKYVLAPAGNVVGITDRLQKRTAIAA